MKLTPKQDYVIHCLQNGWVLITDQDYKGAIVGNHKNQFHINNGIFWRLVEKGLIHQELQSPFNFVLTNEGSKIKTKGYETTIQRN